MDGVVFIYLRCGEVWFELYNRPVWNVSGTGKPCVGSNSQSVSINENVFQSFNSYAKAVMGNKSVDMSGKYGTSNAGAESVGVSDCNKVYKEAGNEAVMSISVDDCIDLDGKERRLHGKEFGDVMVRFLEFILRVIVVMLPTDDNEDVTPVIALKRLSIIALSYTPPGYDFIYCAELVLVGLFILVL
ncbi:hypothetical protein Tco_0743080 [Tanacetum coccineum]